ncbi:aldose epimerase family protein [Peterkaempfera bronchialis]|uniref:Aldose 1-epimerase n=1 Tax=Peterkaempfera bronchialis TaxID=2126346 RepID=A0A345SSM7_9ACTN|nr:aldose epimerase family protein [Peterkaempfera bronchialis]AXI76732.1 galactose mutarotase [Peterkaempfera bronchialis]
MTAAPPQRHPDQAGTPGARSETFAVLADGTPVERWTLRSDNAVTATVLTLGATLHTWQTPDRDGRHVNVVLGSDDFATVLGPARHFGTIVGRYANRIADSRFTLDGTEHRVAPTGRGVTLHGGPDGFAHRVWQAEEVPAAPGGAAVRFSLHSPDGDQGFPGALDATATYTLGADGALTVEYHATADRPTVVNLTNHAYFNLAGEGTGDVLGHHLTVDADHYTPVDDRMVPLGPYEPVAGTPFDFTSARRIGERIRDDHPQLRQADGYDHNWVLRPRPADGAPARAALLHHPATGRTLEVRTTEPGIQVYTGNTFDGRVTGFGGTAYTPYSGVALETQHHPDSPNHPDYPSTVLRPGGEFRSTTVFRPGVASREP